jgi:methylphosphotriester-DNA--protein-cysteine methyltransferase
MSDTVRARYLTKAINALRLDKGEMSMAKTPDWTNVDDVFAFIEKKNKRKLGEGEKELIIGQRQINRRFFEAINLILETLSAAQKPARKSAKPGASKKTAQKKKTTSPLEALKDAFQDLPGERPPGCGGQPTN